VLRRRDDVRDMTVHPRNSAMFSASATLSSTIKIRLKVVDATDLCLSAI